MLKLRGALLQVGHHSPDMPLRALLVRLFLASIGAAGLAVLDIKVELFRILVRQVDVGHLRLMRLR